MNSIQKGHQMTSKVSWFFWCQLSWRKPRHNGRTTGVTLYAIRDASDPSSFIITMQKSLGAEMLTCKPVFWHFRMHKQCFGLCWDLCSSIHRRRCQWFDHTEVSLKQRWGCSRILIILKTRAAILELYNTKPPPSQYFGIFFYRLPPFPTGMPCSPILLICFILFLFSNLPPTLPLYFASLPLHQSLHFSVTCFLFHCYSKELRKKLISTHWALKIYSMICSHSLNNLYACFYHFVFTF